MVCSPSELGEALPLATTFLQRVAEEVVAFEYDSTLTEA